MLIKKGKVILNVTKGAFDALFKVDGWEMTDGAIDVAELHNGTIFMSAGVPAEQTAEAHKEIPSSVPEEQIELQDGEDADYEIPLSEMKVDELAAYAAERSIELKGATKKADIIKEIKAAMEEE